MVVVDLVRTDPARAVAPEDAAAVEPRARRELRLLGGTVHNQGDHFAIGVFGAPVARADAAERAVRAAVRVADAVEDLGALTVGVLVAVHTGSYTLGDDDEAPEEAERRAAALHVHDGGVGSVVVDEPTHLATADLFEYEPVAGGTPSWVAREARGRYGVDVELNAPTPFLGRDHELALLNDLYARVLLESAPHVVTIVGAAGTGKSRLLAEFWNVMDGRPELLYWRQGRSLGDGGGVTLWAMGEVVKGQTGILESDGSAQAADKLDVALRTFLPDDSEARRVGELLAPLVGLVPEEPRLVPRSESFPAWLRFVHAVAATHPMILVFEDLHLADSGTLAFLRFLSERAARVPLLVVCTARLELLERDRGWSSSGGVHRTTITLGPLSGRDTRALMASLDGPKAGPGAEELPVLEAAGGNPLYLEAWARLRDERGGAGPRPPQTLAALMAERIDALPATLRSLIEEAAVVGKVFWPGALEAIGDRGPREVDEGLRELARRELVRPGRRSSVGGQTEWAFWHLVLREAALEHMDPGRRAVAHLAAARWGTGLGGDRDADHAEILAHHAARAAAADPAAALELERRSLARAADRAAGLDPARAAALYERAAALHPPDSPERERLTRRGAAAAEAAAPPEPPSA